MHYFIRFIPFLLFFTACQERKNTHQVSHTFLVQQSKLLADATISIARASDDRNAELRHKYRNKDFHGIQDSAYNVYKTMVKDCDTLLQAFYKLQNKFWEEREDFSHLDFEVFKKKQQVYIDRLNTKYQQICNNKMYGLRVDEITSKVDFFDKRISISLIPEQQFDISDTMQTKLAIRQIGLQIEKSRNEVVNQMSLYMLEYNRIQEAQSYPIFYTHKSYIEQGDSVSAGVGLGTFMYVPEDHCQLIINSKDTLEMNKSIESYQLDTSLKGEHRINIVARVRNRLTGEIFTRESVYEYKVH